MLFRFGRAVPGHVFTRHGGEGEACTSDGSGFGDAEHDIDRPGADVGEVLQGEFRFKSDGDAVFQIEVFKMPGAGFVDAEPCAVTKRVAPWAQLP